MLTVTDRQEKDVFPKITELGSLTHKIHPHTAYISSFFLFLFVRLNFFDGYIQSIPKPEREIEREGEGINLNKSSQRRFNYYSALRGRERERRKTRIRKVRRAHRSRRHWEDESGVRNAHSGGGRRMLAKKVN